MLNHRLQTYAGGGPVLEAEVIFRVDGSVRDEEMTALHLEAFGMRGPGFVPWSR